VSVRCVGLVLFNILFCLSFCPAREGDTKEGIGVLVLTRKEREEIAIGDDITVVVMQIKGKQVRIGIKAGPHITVHRGEVYQRILEENRAAAISDAGALKEAGFVLPQPQEKRSTGVRRVVRNPKPDDHDE
jgi:carbon storage regulator